MQSTAVRERPILFSGPMVRAILEGRKTQTRRVVDLRRTPTCSADCGGVLFDQIWADPGLGGGAYLKIPCVDGSSQRLRCPHGQIGDRLWVKHAADTFDVYFKPIAGWEDRYAVGTDGQVYRIDGAEPEPLAGSPSSKGYLTISLSRGERETHAVHKLVCEAFYGPSPFEHAQVRHLDGDQTNNRPENLDWGTAEQNWQDRKAHGRGMGAEHHSAKLTTQQVSEIRASTLSQRALAARYGVSQSTIHGARSGETWGEHEPAPRNLPAFSLWRSPLFCPRWASRITLEIIDVRVQRVQEISEEDAKSEGVIDATPIAGMSARDWFADLWIDINRKRHGCSWTDNPWVWAISFKVL